MFLYICMFSWVSLFIRYIPDLLSPYTGSSHKKASYQSVEEHAGETWTRWPLWGRGKFQLEQTRIASQQTKPAIYFRSHVKNNFFNCGQSLVNFSLVTIQTIFLKTCSWGVINGWFSNRTGTSVDDGKACRKDETRLPGPNLPLCHWSSELFDLRAPSSTEVPGLLLNQPFFFF